MLPRWQAQLPIFIPQITYFYAINQEIKNRLQNVYILKVFIHLNILQFFYF